MASVWFVRGGGKVYGPLDSAKLKKIVADGKIDQTTEIAQNQAGPWFAAGKVQGLFAASDATPRPLPMSAAIATSPNAKDKFVLPEAAPNGVGSNVCQPNSARSFGHWYRQTVGGLSMPLQIIAWLCGGYFIIPLWWAFSGNLPLLKIAKWAGIVFAGMLAVSMVMTYLEPEAAKKIREENNAKAAAERLANRKAEPKRSKTKNDPCFTHGFMTGFSMATGGAVKPNSDQVDALARRAANELGDSGGVDFNKYNWKTAFWAGWNKGD